eukprot:gene39969-biopygen31867
MYASSHIPLDLYMSSPSRGEHNNSDCNRTHLRVKPLRVISISHHHSEETQFMLPLPLACSNMSSCEHNTENTTTVNANVNNNIIINTSIKANTTAITVVNRPKLENHILRHRRVLVVDDSLMNRKMLCRLVAQRCEQVDAAEDGTVAVCLVKESLINETPYDVILMDYQMPNMDGPTAAKIIRDMGYTGFIIGVTGNVLPADMDQFLQQGADKVIFKPIELPTLDFIVS